jgi:hypothetical protein
MSDIAITIDRSGEKPRVTIGALPGTDAQTYEQAKPLIQRVLAAFTNADVEFLPLTEIEQHSHPEHAIVVNTPHIHH